jgi:stearoyl-CoA desaturase (delta-9 desaturase)
VIQTESLTQPADPRDAINNLSHALLATMHLACLLVFVVPFSWSLVGLCAASYLVRMGAITAGFHRYFSHRSYKTSRAFQLVLAVLGTAAMQNGPLWWASCHRRHHRYSDTPADPHSPLRGAWHAHMGWILDGDHDHPDLSNVADLARYPELRFLDDHKWLPLIAWGVACFAIAGIPGLVWGFVLSSVLVMHASCFINSLAHVWGSRRYATRDSSRNNPWLAVLVLGEGWHNNHHHAMRSARQGFLWWEVDLTYYVLRALASVGVVWDLHAPSPKLLASGLERTAEPAARAQREVDAATPALPAGYIAQPAWVFMDRTGQLAYAFNRAYGLPRAHDRRGAVRPLDQERSYWSITGAAASGLPEAATEARLSFAQAKRYDTELTFARFSSPHRIHPELPALFEARSVELGERGAFARDK